MARIRSSKPEWWSKVKWCALSRDVRFTYKGIWEVMADDEGRFQADPRLVKSAVWPLDNDITTKKIAAWLEAIARVSVTLADGTSAPAILFYDVGAVRYGFMPGFVKHQKISHPSPSKLPSPPTAAREPLRTPSRVPREPLMSDSGAPPEPLRPDVDVDLDLEGERDMDVERDARVREDQQLGPNPAPPADASTATLEPLFAHPSILAFCTAFYREAPPERKRDVVDQLRATLGPGARFRRGEYVRAGSLERLSQKCREVIAEGVREKDAAIVVLLKKLADVSRESPTEAATAKAKAEERQDAAEMRREVDEFAAKDPETFQRLTIRAAENYPGDGPLGEMMRDAWMFSEVRARRRQRESVPA